MLSANPGRIIKEFDVDFPRPRRIEAADFISLRADLLNQIRMEVDKSDTGEYRND